MRKARRAAATNALILASSLTPGRALDAGGDVDAAGAGQRDRLGDRVGVEAARQKPGIGRRKSRARPSRTLGRCRQAAPRPSAAWRRSAASRRRLRRPRLGEVLARRDPDRLHGRAAKSSPIRFTRAGVSRPCNCRISGERRRRCAKRLVVGVDAERDDLGPARASRPSARAVGQSNGAGSSGKTRSRPCPRRRRARRPGSPGVERPQILTIGVIAASFGQTAAVSKGRGTASEAAGGSLFRLCRRPRARSRASISSCAAARILASASR